MNRDVIAATSPPLSTFGKGLRRLAPFGRGIGGHHDGDAVAGNAADAGQRDARVAGGGRHDPLPRSERSRGDGPLGRSTWF